jgi:hypothetical protein
VGSTYLAIRVLVEDVPQLLASGTRFVLARLLLAAFVLWRRGRGRSAGVGTLAPAVRSAC